MRVRVRPYVLCVDSLAARDTKERHQQRVKANSRDVFVCVVQVCGSAKERYRVWAWRRACGDPAANYSPHPRQLPPPSVTAHHPSPKLPPLPSPSAHTGNVSAKLYLAAGYVSPPAQAPELATTRSEPPGSKPQ